MDRGCALVVVWLGLAACGSPPGTSRFDSASSGTEASSGDASTAAPGSTSGHASDTGGAASGVDSTGTGVIFDVAVGDEGTPTGQGCSKIDFLFVVDNSASMGAHQSALLSSFGPFMDTIFATVAAQDYHIMVVDSDGDADISGTCEPCIPNSFWCGDWCEAKADLDVACETTLGAGEVAPYNNQASNTICGVPDGRRYLTSDSAPDEIKSLFQCIGKVGIFGSGAELPMSALVDAVTVESAAGGCNAGFLRDDAILVVTFITDDYPVDLTPDNASTVGSPAAWVDAVVTAKGGNADNVVMLGIMNTPEASCVRGAGTPVVHPTERFVEFVDGFDRGLTGNICSTSYSAFFEEAVGLIDTACDEYEPEG
ncbi:MAG: hypothetical protein AAF721_41585 [Myxococcota bacterium]